MKNLIVIPCCARKIKGGKEKSIYRTTFFEDNNLVKDLIDKRRSRINELDYLISNKNELLPAWERYDGTIYRNLKKHQDLINKLIKNELLDIVIVSAFYGVINYNTVINDYDLSMNQRRSVSYWAENSLLSKSLYEYGNFCGIKNIYTFLSPNTYYKSLGKNILIHTQTWPLGLRGVNNINNEVAKLIFERLNLIAKENNL